MKCTRINSIHRRLNKDHPRSGRCEERGAEGRTEYSFRHHDDRPYTLSRDDYRELCRACHYRQDEPVQQTRRVERRRELDAAAGPAVRLNESDRLLGIGEAAEYLRVTAWTVRRRIHDGDLRAFRIGANGSIRILERDVDALLRPVEPKAQP